MNGQGSQELHERMGFKVKYAWARDTIREGIRRLPKPSKKIEVLSRPSPSRAIDWIRSHESSSGGILAHSGQIDAYPEVTGYVVPTLLQYGERDLAISLVRWLLCIQRADGSYTNPKGVPYVFDTAQVLRGLLAAGELVPGALEVGRRAASYLCSQMDGGGKNGFGVRYSGTIPESVHLYALPPLYQAAGIFHEPKYRVGADRCLENYITRKDALQVGSLTHFLAYELEALIDLGRSDLARPVLDTLREQQAPDGSVRGAGAASWVCTPGLAQLAVCWYKIGQWQPADKALAWLEAHQQPSGGFHGSYGPGASYFPNAELSWAVKFYLDAHSLRLSSFLQRNVDEMKFSASHDDELTHTILSTIKPNDHVLEVGCGSVPFSNLVLEVCSGADVGLMPASRNQLGRVAHGIHVLDGFPESIPCPDNSVDVAFSVGAVMESSNPEIVVGEMVRVTKPGGAVLIIMRPESAEEPPWRTWHLDPARMRKLLNSGCDDVTVKRLRSNVGNLVAWSSRKRSRLSGPDWNRVLIAKSTRRAIIDRVQHNKISEWGQVILLNTSPGERVLEIGSGTGEISLHLAQAGRIVTAIDVDCKSLKFIDQCAQEMHVPVTCVCADALHSLPLSDSSFDCLWSSGLFEHFTPEERQSMLRECARVASKKVIALVPNAACIAYRAGKKQSEEQGTWSYGLEIPIVSMAGDFQAAGLRVLSEYSVGAKHGLSFLPVGHPLRESLSFWMGKVTQEELQSCNQGYVLATIGSRSGDNRRC